MLLTSYYGNPYLDPNRQFLVRISNTAPDGFPLNYVFQDAVPTWETIVGPCRGGLISEDEAGRRYRNLLDSKERHILRSLGDIRRRAAALGREDVVFLCHEKPGRFCHRHVFADWLGEKAGEPVKEYKTPASVEPTLF